MHKINTIINQITNHLTDDLLKKNFLNKIRINNLVGHCYVATEALFYMMSEDDRKQYRPNTLKVDGITHWFLKHRETKHVIDITKDQFPFPLDYNKSKNSGFLTNFPSKRTQTLIKRINEDNQS